MKSWPRSLTRLPPVASVRTADAAAAQGANAGTFHLPLPEVRGIFRALFTYQTK